MISWLGSWHRDPVHECNWEEIQFPRSGADTGNLHKPGSGEGWPRRENDLILGTCVVSDACLRSKKLVPLEPFSEKTSALDTRDDWASWWVHTAPEKERD